MYGVYYEYGLLGKVCGERGIETVVKDNKWVLLCSEFLIRFMHATLNQLNIMLWAVFEKGELLILKNSFNVCYIKYSTYC